MMALVGKHLKDGLQIATVNITAQIYHEIKTHLRYDVTLSTSGITACITSELYKQARLAYDMRLVNQDSHIFYYKDIQKFSKASFSKNQYNTLHDYMQQGDYESILTFLRDIFTTGQSQDRSGLYFNAAYREVISILLDVCASNRIQVSDHINNDIINGVVLDSLNSAEDIVSFLYSTIIDVLKSETDIIYDCKDIVDYVKIYIDDNYRYNLVVNEIALKYAINVNYLSLIFKKYVGCTINKYITRVRIEKACRMLEDSELSIMKIAKMIGYNDPQYFYRVFKKVTGQTAFEYRKQQNKGIDYEYSGR
jgi:two-component system, response regulator YesN